MNKCRAYIPLMCLIFIYGAPLRSPSLASEIILDTYEEGLKGQWDEKSFKGKTLYRVAIDEGRRSLLAKSSSAASALYYRIKYDPRDYPYLLWSWKVKGVLKKGDARKKEGDDYPARVYVVFPSTIFWRTKAINYVWANKLPRGTAVPNSFTSNVMIVAVESGDTGVGTWKDEQRNILQDYRDLFGKEPPKVGAVAIMTDTDNTGEEATAWYGPISITSTLPFAGMNRRQ